MERDRLRGNPLMPFDYSRPFQRLGQFDGKRPFEKVGFDPQKPFEIVDELLNKLKIKTIEKPVVVPPKSLVGKFVEPIKKEKPALTSEDVTNLVQDAISKIPKPKPDKIIEKVIEKQIVKEVKKDEKKDTNEFDSLKKEIESLKELFDKFKQVLPLMASSGLGGSGVIGLPTLEGNNGKTLQVVNNQPKWQTSAGVGVSSSVYTPTNVTTDRSFNAAVTSLDEVANVLGTLIIDLQTTGIIQ